MPSRTPLQGRLLAARDRVHRRKSYPVTDAPCAPLRCVRSAVVSDPGGYIIRPYEPACGPLVGAACMAARNQVPIRAGVRWFPSAVGARSAVAHPTQWCGTGGYIIRPYGPACGPLVGAACMAARNQVPIRAGVRWFPSAVGARSAVAHPTQWCGTGGYIIRPYGPACGPLVGAACMAARNQVPIRAGVRWFPSAVGARSAVMHPNQRCGIGRIYNPPLRARLRPSRRGGLYGRPEPGSDSRRGSMVPFSCRGAFGGDASEPAVRHRADI